MPNSRPYIWGCDFDPNPDIDSLRRKLINFMANGGKAVKRGPFDIFRDYSALFKNEKSDVFAEKVPCPEWVCATPDFEMEIFPEMYRDFINRGGCLTFSERFGAYVLSRTPDDRIPITLGVDHCLTGGLYKAVNEKYGDTVLVVLDRHTDAYSPYVHNRMIGYAIENPPDGQDPDGFEYYGEDFRGSYDTGSFLRHTINEKTLESGNLLLLGIQDTPDKRLRKINDPRVKDYLDEYDQLIDGGVFMATLEALRAPDFYEHRKKMNDHLAGRNVYLSVDIDVCKGKLGCVSRYGATDGLMHSDIRRLLGWLGLARANLVGMDIMELDVNALRENEVTEKEIAASYDELLSAVFFDISDLTSGG